MAKVAGLLPPPPPPPPSRSSLEDKITPNILLIIVLLSVIFFISGLLYLLIRYLLRPLHRHPDDSDDATAFQGQLQQLFHLHDAGVDQSFIDALPVFLYKSIIGLKDPFDCAVCLCEFEPDDKLRLLPKCSHAFHVACIDTWLLSHSTCPLCRRGLVPDHFSPAPCPLLFVLESGSEQSSRDFDVEPARHNHNSLQKALEAAAIEEASSVSDEKVVSIKLGKFKTAANSGEGSSNGERNLDERRCFSMGSYEYVMDESSSLRVAIKPAKFKPAASAKRVAMSECDCLSRRFMFVGNASLSGRSLSKRESFSVSKIWLRTDEKEKGSSRRSLSFRLPETKMKRSVSSESVSEFSVSVWEKSGCELDSDVEAGNSGNGTVSSRADERPSFARRTLLWIAGRPNRVGNHV